MSSPRTTGDGYYESCIASRQNSWLPFIHAAYGFGTAAHPDATIHDIRELAEVVGNVV